MEFSQHVTEQFDDFLRTSTPINVIETLIMHWSCVPKKNYSGSFSPALNLHEWETAKIGKFFFFFNECERQFTVLFLATKFQGSNTIDASLVNINPGDKWIHITFHSYA